LPSKLLPVQIDLKVFRVKVYYRRFLEKRYAQSAKFAIQESLQDLTSSAPTGLARVYNWQQEKRPSVAPKVGTETNPFRQNVRSPNDVTLPVSNLVRIPYSTLQCEQNLKQMARNGRGNTISTKRSLDSSSAGPNTDP
jgi:hypothetical protein